MLTFQELEDSNEIWEATTEVVEALRQSRVIYAPEIESIVEALQVDIESAIEDPTISAVVEFARTQIKGGTLSGENLIYLIGRMGLTLHCSASKDPDYNDKIEDDKEGFKLLVKNLRLFIYNNFDKDPEYAISVASRVLKIILHEANKRSGTSYKFKDIEIGHLDILEVEEKYHCKISFKMSDRSQINTMMIMNAAN